jgi:hypothetical protein
VGLLCNLDSILKWELDVLNYFLRDDFYSVTLLNVNLTQKSRRKSFKYKLKILPYVIAFKIEYCILKFFRKINYLDKVDSLNLNVDKHSIFGYQDGVNTFLNFDSFEGQYDYIVRLNGIGILFIPDNFSTPILSLHHGDMYLNRGGPAGFWEIYFKQQHSQVSLQRLNNRLDKGDLLYQYCCKTIPYSFVLNQDNLYSVSSRVFDIYFKYKCQKLRPIDFTPSLLSIPDILNIFHYFFIIVQKLWLKISTLNQRWVVCLESNHKRQFYQAQDGDWYADPFFLNPDTIIVEKFLTKYKKGILVCFDIESKLEITLLEESFHLSHPFVYEENNKIFVIPESLGGNAVKLYELCNNKLIFIKDLLVGRFVDTLLINTDKGCYLLTTSVDSRLNEEKRLYYSEDLVSSKFIEIFDFQPITDPRISRSAGYFKLEDNYILNYCQNPFPFYGRSITACKLYFNGQFEIMYEIKVDAMKYKGIHHFSNKDEKYVYDLRLR